MRKKKLSLLAIPLMACTMMFFAPSTVSATGDVTPTPGARASGDPVAPSTATVTITEATEAGCKDGSCEHVISGASGTIKVASGIHHITLDGVTVDPDPSGTCPAFEVSAYATVYLKLQ